MTVEIETAEKARERMHSFHQSLRAAVAAGAELDLGPGRPDVAASGAASMDSSLGGTATPAKLDRLETLLVEWTTSHPTGFSLDGTLTDQSVTTDDVISGLPTGYLAAYRAYAESERMDLILDSLSLQCSVAQDLAGTVRPVWFYLAAMSLVATVGVAIFAEFSLPQFVAMRADLALMPKAPVYETWLTLTNIGWLMLALPLLSLALMLLGFSTSGSALIAGWLGGQRYRSARKVAAGARIEQAIWRRRDRVADISNPGERPHDARRVRCAQRVGWSLVADSATSLAHHRLQRMRISLPTLFIAMLGGTGVLLYGLLLFGPLVVLIHDLATITTDTGMWP